MATNPASDLPKTFDPAAIEARWYAHWENEGLFRPERPDATPFTIVNPPPNVTGSLHIGHALDNTLQDIVIRYERLRGKDALWVVGTDHAGIATQMVVERQLGEMQQKRTDFTREAFVDKVWEWKAESGGQITRQLRRLGCSMDWSREQFTMDPHFSQAVTKVFVELHKRGLLYRDKRLVNWDPHFRTAISDLEVETKETAGHFWHFRYPLADGVKLANGADHIVVATTRPETMLADMAVAVNAEDPRYRDVIGKDILQPITGRRFKVVADEHADPELGSGAVKITPGHDFNDFDVGKRAGIKAGDMLNMFDADAKVVQTQDGLVPAEYIGLDRFDARRQVVAQMKALGMLVPHIAKTKDGEPIEQDAEPRTIQTPYGDRSGVVIEPWLTDQWYVDAEKLAVAPMQAVRDGAIEIVPKSWEKTFFNWMENIQPWCVSRQLWWGHQVPAWYDEDGHPYVAETEEEAQAQAGNKKLIRDPDVLDTWFSSALWPFATLGWPSDTSNPVRPELVEGPSFSPDADGEKKDGASTGSARTENGLLSRHYPNDLLISGFDILFFWDARMAMQGLEFMGDVPWRKLYLHGLVRAADGQKMSKSKGNVVDPLGLIDQYGADALRFFMAAMESQGRDVKMDEKRVEGYRNFATKLWNAARFLQSNGIGGSTTLTAPKASLAVNRWIISETIQTVQALDLALADLRFDAAANTIYHFIWDRFCDWYLELIKPELSSVRAEPVEDPSLSSEAKPEESTALRQAQDKRVEETRAVAGWAFDQILVMLHPFMPFITEELWHAMPGPAHPRDYDLIVAKWPMADPESMDAGAVREVDWLIRLVSAIRAARTELNVPPGARLALHVGGAADETSQRLAGNWAMIARLARLSDLSTEALAAGGGLQVVVDEATFSLPLEGVIDIAAEKTRLTKAMEAAAKEAKSLEGRLNNPAFVEKAKPEAVDKARADHAEKSAEAERLRAALERLG